MSKNTSSLLNGILLVAVVILIGGFICKEPMVDFFRREEVTTESEDVSLQIDISDWLPIPYFGEDFSFYFKHPPKNDFYFSDFYGEGNQLISSDNFFTYKPTDNKKIVDHISASFFYDTG